MENEQDAIMLGPLDFIEDYWTMKTQAALIRRLRDQAAADRQTIAEQAEQLRQLRAMVEIDRERRVVTVAAPGAADGADAVCR